MDAQRPDAVDLTSGHPSAVDLTSGYRTKGRPLRAERERALAVLARRQHGVVSIRQLERRLGFSHQAVLRAVASGRLHRVYRSVYAVGHTDLSPRGECLAAVLAVGPGAVLSYYSGGWLWGIWQGSPKPLHVTAFVPRHHQTPTGIVRHRARNWDESERGIVDGIPVTSLARTVLDLAWKLRGEQLQRLLARVEELGLLNLGAIHAVIERNRGHHGARYLRHALAIYQPPLWTRSQFERRFGERLVAGGLPRPATGWNEVGHEIDVYWPERRFGIELDSYKTHGTHRAFEADRQRDRDFALAEIDTIRFTEYQFRREPDDVVADVATLLFRHEVRST